MSSFRCECGASIDNISDHLSHKGRLLSDIEYFDLHQILIDRVSSWLEQNIKKLAKDAGGREEALEPLGRLLLRNIRRSFRDIYVCTKCGRLYIEPKQGKAYIQFNPAESPITNRTREVLSSVRGRVVSGWWNKKDGKGKLCWEKFPWDEKAKEIPYSWEYKDWTLLEQRYYKLLDQLKDAGVQVRESFLVNGNKVVHRFSADFPETDVSAE